MKRTLHVVDMFTVYGTARMYTEYNTVHIGL